VKSSLQVSILLPSELMDADWQTWAKIAQITKTIETPYADPDYFRSIGNIVPNALIARFSILHEQGEKISGYMGFQVRGCVLQPLGAPLTDYLSLRLVDEYDQSLSPSEILSALRALLLVTNTNRFEGMGILGLRGRVDDDLIEFVDDDLTDFMERVDGIMAQTRRLADLRGGFDQWYRLQDEGHGKYFKNLRRCQRNLQRDFPQAQFTWQIADQELLDWVIKKKRQQYAKSHYHDIFACGWTRELLLALAQSQNHRLKLFAGVLRLEGRIMAAEIALSDGDCLHLWYPAYDEAYARHSLGIVLVFEIIKEAAQKGIQFVDFGTGSESYKIPFTTPFADCARLILSSPKRSLFYQATEYTSALVTNLYPLKFKPWRLAVSDRMMSIRGCEVKKMGRLRAQICLWERFLEKSINLAKRSLKPNH